MKTAQRAAAFCAAVLTIVFMVSCGKVSYESSLQYLKYDHISRDGVSYYVLDEKNEIPDEYEPFGETVKIQIVDSDGTPYDAERYEDAYTYRNDVDMKYLYFGSAKYTSDRSLAAEWKLKGLD